MAEPELTTFAASGEEAITRTIDLENDIPNSLPQDELEAIYDIARTVEEIEKGNYKRVSVPHRRPLYILPQQAQQIALQFPDELLPHSVPIFRMLKSRISESRELYVLADTSYGRCVSA